MSLIKCKVHSNKLLTIIKKIIPLKIFSFIAGVVDAANKYSFANTSNFRKGPIGILRGPGETDS